MVAHRNQFVAEWRRLEPQMLKADDSDPSLSMPTWSEFFADKSKENPGIIPIFHDECSFSQNDVSSSHWYHVEDGPSKLRPKSDGANYMVSDLGY